MSQMYQPEQEALKTQHPGGGRLYPSNRHYNQNSSPKIYPPE